MGELVTLSDIAALLEVSKRAVRGWRAQYKDWPPVAGTATRQGRGWPAYDWTAIQAWCEEKGLPDRTRQAGVKRAQAARDEEDHIV